MDEMVKSFGDNRFALSTNKCYRCRNMDLEGLNASIGRVRGCISRLRETASFQAFGLKRPIWV
jgi:hypothetical protein